MKKSLSVNRITQAIETLRDASFDVHDFPGAIGEPDSHKYFIEAMRHLTALVQHLYGDDEWKRVVDRE